MKQKATIVKIGTFENGEPMDFIFNGEGQNVIGIDIQPDGSILYYGYTVEELKEITDKEDVLH